MDLCLAPFDDVSISAYAPMFFFPFTKCGIIVVVFVVIIKFLHVQIL